MATQICSFCLGNDHYLRNKSIVTCPKLQMTQCNICYNFGHTTNFCKEKPRQLVTNYSKPKPQIVKPKKNDFITVASRFAALDVKESDVDNSSDYDCDVETETNTQKNNEDYDENEDELPPVSAIVWGKGFATQKKKWSD